MKQQFSWHWVSGNEDSKAWRWETNQVTSTPVLAYWLQRLSWSQHRQLPVLSKLRRWIWECGEANAFGSCRTEYQIGDSYRESELWRAPLTLSPQGFSWILVSRFRQRNYLTLGKEPLERITVKNHQGTNGSCSPSLSEKHHNSQGTVEYFEGFCLLGGAKLALD